MKSLINTLLYFLSKLYYLITKLRFYLYKLKILPSYTSKKKVICVGNITSGGSGKSPFSVYLSKTLQEFKYKPVILTRGYGGNQSGPYLVQSTDNPIIVGDEAKMFKELLSDTNVVVSRSRVNGAKLIESGELGNSIILDDGYQHFALNRDLNLLLIDINTKGVKQGFIDDQILPLGMLRETLDDGLKRCSAIILVSKRNINDTEIQSIRDKWVKYNKPLFVFNLSPFDIYNLDTKESLSLDMLSEYVDCAFTAIAKPESFYEMIEKKGVVLEFSKTYPDHFNFDLNEIEAFVKKSKKGTIVTEKDAVKLANLSDKRKIYVLRLKGEFAFSEDKERFQSLLCGALKT